MAKIISYKFLTAEVNHGTEEEPKIEQILLNASIKCETQAQFDANYPIVEKEAIPGSIEITGEFDGESETPSDLDKLDARLTYVEMMTGLLEV